MNENEKNFILIEYENTLAPRSEIDAALAHSYPKKWKERPNAIAKPANILPVLSVPMYFSLVKELAVIFQIIPSPFFPLLGFVCHTINTSLLFEVSMTVCRGIV